MEAKFSQRVKDVISFSREEALRLGNDFIGGSAGAAIQIDSSTNNFFSNKGKLVLKFFY